MLLIGIATTDSVAQIPATMNLQGYLVNDDGPVTTTLNLTIKIYTDVNAPAVYSEDLNNVSVQNGFYNVRIGTNVPITLKASQRLWYELLQGGVAITSKIEFDATPFALGSKYSENAQKADNALKADTATFAKRADTATASPLTISQIKNGNNNTIATKGYVLDALANAGLDPGEGAGSINIEADVNYIPRVDGTPNDKSLANSAITDNGSLVSINRATTIKGVLTSDRTNAQITQPEQLTTKGYVDDAIGTATTKLATKEYVDTNISSATAKFTTKEYVDTNISSATTKLATKGYVDTNISSATAKLATKGYVDTAVANSGYPSIKETSTAVNISPTGKAINIGKPGIDGIKIDGATTYINCDLYGNNDFGDVYVGNHTGGTLIRGNTVDINNSGGSGIQIGNDNSITYIKGTTNINATGSANTNIGNTGTITTKGKITSDRTNAQITDANQLTTKKYVDDAVAAVSSTGGGYPSITETSTAVNINTTGNKEVINIGKYGEGRIWLQSFDMYLFCDNEMIIEGPLVINYPGSGSTSLNNITAFHHHVHTVSSSGTIDYPCGLYNVTATSVTLGTSYVPNGQHIWIANRSGATLTISGKTIPNKTIAEFIFVAVEVASAYGGLIYILRQFCL